MKLAKIRYEKLNAREKENYNFSKVSGILADYGFMTMRLSADWQGADFIAQHVDGTFLKVQLKARVHVLKKYVGKDIYIAFPDNGSWYLCPHDDLMRLWLSCSGIGKTKSWNERGGYSQGRLTKPMREALECYKIG